MTSFKQELKQILIKKQHKVYEKELNSKNLTYDIWIREQESKLQVDKFIVEENIKNQTNDSEKLLFGSEKRENEGNHSKLTQKPFKMITYGKKGRNLRFLYEGVEDFCKNLSVNVSEKIADVILLTLYDGEISQIAPALIAEKLLNNENIILIYGDEDTCDEKGVRTAPWLKPDWLRIPFFLIFILEV